MLVSEMVLTINRDIAKMSLEKPARSSVSSFPIVLRDFRTPLAPNSSLPSTSYQKLHVVYKSHTP